jgi:hypothetical protein
MVIRHRHWHDFVLGRVSLLKRIEYALPRRIRSARLAQEEESSITRCVTKSQFEFPRDRREAVFLFADVRYWPKADMTVCTAHVRFRG